MRSLLLLALVIPFVIAQDVQSFDGLFNNPVYPTWGYEGTALTRFSLPVYGDGVYLPNVEDRPNARVLSNVVFRKDNVNEVNENQRDLTALFSIFGQKLVQEITETVAISHPPEYFSIPTPGNDDVYSGTTMPMVRSEYAEGSGRNVNHPREILNEVTPFIDLANIYGPNRAWNDVLRVHEGGRMIVTEQGLPPFNEIGLPMVNVPPPLYHNGQNNFRVPDNRENYVFGNPRANENPAVFVLHVVWLREHNRMADEISQQNPDLSDEEIFNRARQFTIARYQHVVFNEWLPLFLDRTDPLPVYEGYDVHLHPQIMIEFSTVAMRFGHSLVPFGFLSALQDIRLCNSFFNTREEFEVNQNLQIESLIVGMANQKSEAGDRFVVEDLRSFLFGGVEISRRDLIAINIQRGREHGIPGYNALKVAFGQVPASTFNDLTTNVTVANILRGLYNDNIDAVDAFVGGMLETDEVNGSLGPLFDAIITEQFRRLRNADRFYYQNLQNEIFTLNEINMIEQDTFADIINRNTNNVNIQNAFVNAAAASFSPLSSSACTPVTTHDFSITQRYHVAIYVILLLFMLVVMYLAVKKSTMKKDDGKVLDTRDIESIRRTTTVSLMKELKRDMESNRDNKNKRLHLLFEYFTTNREQFLLNYRELLSYCEIDVKDEVTKRIVVTMFDKYHMDNGDFRAFKEMINSLESRLQRGTLSEQENEFEDSFSPNVNVSMMTKKIMYNSKAMIWLILYMFLVILIFVERAYVYRYERENTGFRQVTGNGVVVTRGAASVISFTMALIPLTMAKGLITKLASNASIAKVAPFEYMNEIHKIIGYTFTLFTCVHIIGHTFNFYFLSSLHPRDADVIFPEIYILSNELPTFFGFWIFSTTTGLTGLFLVITVFLMIPFTVKVVRERNYDLFWYSHKLYIPLYILTLLHGSAQLIQEPLFWHYCLASLLIFGLDRMLRTPMMNIEVRVIDIVKKPSNVIYLVLEKPKGFNYEAGQWCYIIRKETGYFSNLKQIRHPFTMTTAPCEKRLGFHIKMQDKGSWTSEIFENPPMKVRLDGPFGNTYTSFQNDYQVIVLIGGGVGITPFASILKSLVFRANLRKKKFDSLGLSEITKVYLFWTSKTVRSFEWFSELLNELQEDLFGLSIYQFITGDVTTDLHNVAILFGELQHRQITKTSLVSKNKWNISFGRPDFDSMFSRLGELYQDKTIGVFSCGSSKFNDSVKEISTSHDFDHHSESF